MRTGELMMGHGEGQILAQWTSLRPPTRAVAGSIPASRANFGCPFFTCWEHVWDMFGISLGPVWRRFSAGLGLAFFCLHQGVSSPVPVYSSGLAGWLGWLQICPGNQMPELGEPVTPVSITRVLRH